MDVSDIIMNDYVWMAASAVLGWVWGKISGKKQAKQVLDWALPVAELVAGKTKNPIDDKAVQAIKSAVSALPDEHKDELRDMLRPIARGGTGTVTTPGIRVR